MEIYVVVVMLLLSVHQNGITQSITEPTTTTQLSIAAVSEGIDSESNFTTDDYLSFETNSTEVPNSTSVGPTEGAKAQSTQLNTKSSKSNLCTCNLQYQNGLFCIIKSNLPPSYTLQRKQPLKTFDDAQSEKINKFSWQNYATSIDQRHVFDRNEKFRYGNPIWLVRKNGMVKFQVPNKFITNRCILEEDVLAMKNVENVCTQTDISEENPYLSLKTFFEHIYVISAPNLVNMSKYKHGIFEDCPRNVCLPIVPKICDPLSNVCVDVAKNDSRAAVKCSFRLREYKNDCVNIVKTIEYNFYHGNAGFSNVVVLATLENITSSFGRKETEFTQKFSVNFWWNNQTSNFSENLSGNPGYLIGKPILTAKLVNVGNKTDVSLKIKRNPLKFTENFLTIPENELGDCVSSEKAHLTVEFGYDLLTKCRLWQNIPTGNRTVNGTAICRKIQKSILDLWSVYENRIIGSFGNSNANVLSDWLKILLEVRPDSVMNKTFGSFNRKNGHVFCSGLVSHLIIDIYHSKIDIDELMNQEKILGVSYSFDTVNKSFTFHNHTRSVFFEMDLKTSVVFYDISGQKQKKMVDSPTVNIKLPHDFFYPFIKVDNGVFRMKSTYMMWFNIVFLFGCQVLINDM
nr:uncharacterized protein LOC111511606 [Leptinotarsa decemlineata]